MIRNVVVGRLPEAADEATVAALEAGLAAIATLELPGMIGLTVGRDAGLRAGGWDFAIVNDFVDADAYRAYDLDEDHLRYRAAIAAACADIQRVQFELPDE